MTSGVDRTLFREAPSFEWQRNVVVGYAQEPAGAYIFGYQEAVHVLMSHVEDTGGAESLFYPIVYLHRHAIELLLKEGRRSVEAVLRLAERAGQSYGRPKSINRLNKELGATHRLLPLYDKLHERVRLISWDFDEEPGIRDSIEQLHEFDETSTRLRYPTDRSGNTSFSAPVRLDLVHAHARLSDAARYLGYVLEWLRDVAAYVGDYLRELESESPRG